MDENTTAAPRPERSLSVPEERSGVAARRAAAAERNDEVHFRKRSIRERRRGQVVQIAFEARVEKRADAGDLGGPRGPIRPTGGSHAPV